MWKVFIQAKDFLVMFAYSLKGYHTTLAYVSFDNRENLQKFMDATMSWPTYPKAVPDPGIGFQAQLLLSTALSKELKSKILLPTSSLPKEVI